jgi:hypothetical protein
MGGLLSGRGSVSLPMRPVKAAWMPFMQQTAGILRTSAIVAGCRDPRGRTRIDLGRGAGHGGEDPTGPALGPTLPGRASTAS